MENSISVDEYCNYCKIDVSFIKQLAAHGLLSGTTNSDVVFLVNDDLPAIERYTHLHYDLDINIEGIEAIDHLLKKVNELQQEITYLHNKLHATTIAV